MRKKVITIDCNGCDFCSVNDNSKFICGWGEGKKIMNPPKGKKIIRCNLIRKD
jgi:hypothetical protein